MFPPSIIFINSDFPILNPDGYAIPPLDGYINPGTLNTLITQLRLDESITFAEFNARVEAEPNYPDIIHLQNLRILVILPDFHDDTNRNLADVVLFYSHGLVSVMKNNYGPNAQTYPLERLNIYEILRANNSSFVVILPQAPPKPGRCDCHLHTGPGGILGIELRAGDTSGVHLPNCDNEAHNKDFINRK